MLRHFPASSARTSHPAGLWMENIHLALQLLLPEALTILMGERAILNCRQGASADLPEHHRTGSYPDPG